MPNRNPQPESYRPAAYADWDQTRVSRQRPYNPNRDYKPTEPPMEERVSRRSQPAPVSNGRRSDVPPPRRGRSLPPENGWDDDDDDDWF